MKSGLINLEVNFIDKLENYILANGIKGYKWTRDLIISKDKELTQEEIEIFEYMEEIRRPIINLYNKR